MILFDIMPWKTSNFISLNENGNNCDVTDLRFLFLLSENQFWK